MTLEMMLAEVIVHDRRREMEAALRQAGYGTSWVTVGDRDRRRRRTARRGFLGLIRISTQAQVDPSVR